MRVVLPAPLFEGSQPSLPPRRTRAKAEELMQKYDKHSDGLDQDEFVDFVSDPSLPGIMSVALRTYARKLADIGGQVKGAKLRDEAEIWSLS